MAILRFAFHRHGQWRGHKNTSLTHLEWYCTKPFQTMMQCITLDNIQAFHIQSISEADDFTPLHRHALGIRSFQCIDSLPLRLLGRLVTPLICLTNLMFSVQDDAHRCLLDLTSLPQLKRLLVYEDRNGTDFTIRCACLTTLTDTAFGSSMTVL